VKWSCFQLYAILDIFSRRFVKWGVVALRDLRENPFRVTEWRIEHAENATLFKALFATPWPSMPCRPTN